MDLITTTPIASIRNTYVRGSEVVQHIGLVYACGSANLRRAQEDNPDLRGLFIPLNAISRLFLVESRNREIIQYAVERIPALLRGGATAEKEVHEQQRYRTRYHIHRKVIKPMMNVSDGVLSFLMRRTSCRTIKDQILSSFPPDCGYILDVSAGDHRPSLLLGSKANVVVLNDVSWDTLSVLAREVEQNVRSSRVTSSSTRTCYGRRSGPVPLTWSSVEDPAPPRFRP